jgi:hypothetical protein
MYGAESSQVGSGGYGGSGSMEVDENGNVVGGVGFDEDT